MNPAQLLAHFDRISEAPDAIPRLRHFILDLAVRGKLVEQDPNDEPASELLKSIQAEKERRVREGKIKKQQPLPSLVPDEIPFELPERWQWLRLGEIGFTQTGTTPSSNNPEYFGDYIPFVKPADLTGNIINYSGDGISKEGIEHSRLIPKHSVLMVCIGSSIGKVNVTNRDVCCNQQINTVTPYFEHLTTFTSFALRAPYFQKLILANAGMGTLPIISKGKWEILPIPLPPLAEQRRIVAKVDELMAVCDRLEAAQAERENRRDRLVAASLQRLNQPVDAQSFREDARFHLNHLPCLTTRPAHIQQLRQTILNLAVRGRLVLQDPNDEPAAELLKRINAEKARLMKEGKIKKEGPVESNGGNGAPFTIPKTWKWARFSELTELITKGSSPKWQGIAYVSKDKGVVFVTSENVGNYRLRKLDELKYVEKRFNEIEPRSVLQYGDILMNLVGASIGRTAIYDLREVANISQAVAMIRLIKSAPNLCVEFLLYYLNSPSAIQLMMASQVVTAQPNISLTNAREFPIPVPPLAEQHRIVAKADELMALCARLEAQLTTAQTESLLLLESVLHQALSIDSMCDVKIAQKGSVL